MRRTRLEARLRRDMSLTGIARRWHGLRRAQRRFPVATRRSLDIPRAASLVFGLMTAAVFAVVECWPS